MRCESCNFSLCRFCHAQFRSNGRLSVVDRQLTAEDDTTVNIQPAQPSGLALGQLQPDESTESNRMKRRRIEVPHQSVEAEEELFIDQASSEDPDQDAILAEKEEDEEKEEQVSAVSGPKKRKREEGALLMG